MRTIKFSIQYSGTNYSGWQIQTRETTIQGVLEQALVSITGDRTRITGAARTDAGVHAIEQVAAFKTSADLEPDIFMRAFNAHLPDDIRVIDACEVPEDFHPRYSARNKTYTYLISSKREYSVFLKNFSWVMPYQLAIDSMKKASNYLIGKQDFSSFRTSGCSAKNPLREVHHIEVEELTSVNFMSFEFHVPVITVSIKANAFLRHMARNIVGTLIEFGRDKLPAEKMKDILNAKDRSAAGQTAPACGLFLEKIVY